jgi:spermidine synthase
LIRWVQLDAAAVPDGGGELRLMKRGAEFSIMAGSNELMNSRLSGSEEALATLVLARLKDRPAPHLLVGGLGMGFTLRAALRVAGPEAKVTVVELVPAVVAWARGAMGELFGESLEDPRVRLIEGDVGTAIRARASEYDGILLDVDNGPEGLTRRENDRLYSLEGLAAAKAALTSGGVLAVWSSAPHPPFTERLRQAGFGVHETPVRAREGRKGSRHMIWLAQRTD